MQGDRAQDGSFVVADGGDAESSVEPRAVGQQAGGWSITWQGTGVTNANFPNGQSIWGGLSEAVRASGGTATLSASGSFTTKPDVAIVVFGEAPYAEFSGDRPTLEYSPDDKSNLELLRRLKKAGVPTVSVFLSGRPLWVNPELNASDAFVAAWLPGTEGGGVADVLVAGRDGKPKADFRGTLSFSWPKRLDQYVLNRRDPNYDPLFPFGYGLSYAKGGQVPTLDEARPANAGGDQNALFVRGRLAPGATLRSSGAVTQARVDRQAQEDSVRLAFTGAGELAVQQAQPIDLSRESNGQLSLILDYRVTRAPTGTVTLGMAAAGAGGRTASVPITGALRTAGSDWTELAVPLRCFADQGVDMAHVTRPAVIAATGAAGIDLSGIRVASAPPGPVSCGQR